MSTLLRFALALLSRRYCFDTKRDYVTRFPFELGGESAFQVQDVLGLVDWVSVRALQTRPIKPHSAALFLVRNCND